jgi:hypothetical protein
VADSKLIWAATRPEDCAVFFRAPLGTTLPTAADAPWDDLTTPWEDHGWVGDDGISNQIKRDTTQHQAFGGDIVKTTFNKYTEQLVITFLESNEAVLKTVFGEDNVDVTSSGGHEQITVSHSALPPERFAYVARMIDGQKTRLLRIQEGQVIDIDTIPYVNKDLVKYKVTLECYKPDPDTDAVTEIIDNEDVTSSASS